MTDLADDQLRLHQCLPDQVVVDGYKADVRAIQRFTVDLSGGIVDAKPL